MFLYFWAEITSADRLNKKSILVRSWQIVKDTSTTWSSAICFYGPRSHHYQISEMVEIQQTDSEMIKLEFQQNVIWTKD